MNTDELNRDELNRTVHEEGIRLLTRDKSGKGFICPICGSGSGPHGTGITTEDGVHFRCWAGCFKHSDVIDIFGQRDGITGYTAKLKHAAQLLGYQIDDNYSPPAAQTNAPTPKGGALNWGDMINEDMQLNWGDMINVNTQTAQTAESKEQEVDYTQFFLQAQANLSLTNYHRGISLETLKQYGVGFIENWRHPKVPGNVPYTPRLIIPTSSHSYLARDTRTEIPENQKQYAKQKVGPQKYIYNIKRLYQSYKPVFVTEGEIDALSIIDVGGEAVALGSTANVSRFIEKMKNKPPARPIIIAMDNDEAGRKASGKLEQELKNLNIPYLSENICGQYKDPNEHMMRDRKFFEMAVDVATEHAKNLKTQAEEELEKESVGSNIKEILHQIIDSVNAPCFSTGFNELDRLLDGGFYAGLYCIGAISSLGKTTFCLQVADNIAKQGKDVLIFSLEMARNELAAKSISRLTYEMAEGAENQKEIAKSTRGVLVGTKYKYYKNEEMDHIRHAFNEYGRYAEHIYITTGIGDIGVNEIREKVDAYQKIKQHAPVVLIDYMQILSPADPHASDKQNTDKAVLELKRISRDFNTPVIGISSFNRDNYNAPVNMTSFKESGAIEYSSDVLIGLQYTGMDYKENEKDGARQVRIRELMKTMRENAADGGAQDIEVKVLKNRNGIRGEAYLKFYPKYNYFRGLTESERIEYEESGKIESKNQGAEANSKA